jgi:hypothetical protein
MNLKSGQKKSMHHMSLDQSGDECFYIMFEK